jgi:hypothetical protein
VIKPSPETAAIRQVVDRLTNDDLYNKGPKDFKPSVEALGLTYSAVREKISNELARARRKRGIKKGQGCRGFRPVDDSLTTNLRAYLDFCNFCEDCFGSWAKANEVVTGLVALSERLGGFKNLQYILTRKSERENERKQKEAT